MTATTPDTATDEVDMTLPAVDVRARMTREWADQHSPDWTVRQHLHRDVPTLIAEVERLHAEVQRLAPTGVTVREEWGVHSDDGTIYQVEPPTQDKAYREATLLRRGDPSDPEMTPEPGAAPAHRYVMETPEGTVATGWRWPCSWTPPATEAAR